MAYPFIGEIRLFGFRRIPASWAACDGSLLQISGNETLYTLLGTTFGGDGVTTFGVPDLRGRVPISQGNGGGLTPRALGEVGGEDSHTLQSMEMPSHSHALISTSDVGSTATPGVGVHLATTNISSDVVYAPQANVTSYAVLATSVGTAGNSQAHDNMMPSLTGNYCICTDGVFPSPQ